MKNIKRIFSLMLAICLVIGTLPMTIFANNLQTMGETGSWDSYIEENGDNPLDTTTDSAISFYSVTKKHNISMEQQSNPRARMRTMSNTEVVRYTALVIDTSGSMSGIPMARAKEATKKFVEQVLGAKGENYVAIIDFSTNAIVKNGFTNDLSALKSTVDSLYANGGTNTNGGLESAERLLGEITVPNAIKNLVILSDGLPEAGAISADGYYTPDDHSRVYRYANVAYDTATRLKKEYFVYSLGFFHSMYGKNLEFGRRFMSDLQNAGYYDVVNVDDIDFVFDELANEITKQSGKFYYAGGNGQDYSNTYYYDDNYFKESSFKYNEHLATMSLCLELSAYNSSVENFYANKSINAQALLAEIGFSGIETNHWFRVKPTKDSIGAIAANKKITLDNDEYTLIALAVRGGGYESEWASNFTIGENGKHQGFDKAKEQVLDFLGEYIDEHGISGDIKLWITGYSRGAATANMVAGALDSNVKFNEACNLDRKDLFAYTFETPAGVLDWHVHKMSVSNIYNIINPNDPVTMVAPKKWGFRRYGKDIYLPSNTTSTEKTYQKDKDKKLF